MRVAVAIELNEEERATLDRYARGRSTPARLVLRAKIVLRTAKGMENKDIAAELETLPKTVGLWRRRFAEQRLAGIEKDAPGRGRPATIKAKKVAEIVRITTQETPPNNALEHAGHGQGGRGERVERASHLARARPQASPHPDVQAEPRS